ncbi:uncharacterized protein K02A2.6-like [Plodia interpunctella]|uniref:uncharacterized protein K02A2.6-like n=1 Tax=Plodia interpunctella TaxID=58824 RepID=UPI002367D493|nr:uncharacterized protein K02A2.6-like [Plodia interpunctella]
MEEVSDDEDIFNIELMTTGTKPFYIKVNIDGFPVESEIDTGSRISAISESFYKQYFTHKPITVQNIVLRSYAGSPIESLGSITVNVTLGHVTANNLTLYVIKNGSRPLLGREWIRALNIKQISFNKIREDSIGNRLATEFPEVFTSKLGTCTKTIKLELSDKSPVYVRARPVPLALRARVQAELERLEAEGTIYRVENSEYGTPIVPVVKENGDIRICGDYKVTINPKLKREFYPLPRIEELFATLSGGEEYSKIDLTHAYAQTMLTEDSQPFTAITTHLGTFAYRRTPYGLSCIPEKFQKLMEETLRGVSNTVVFLDDIAVTGATRALHLCNLRLVLERLKVMGLTVKMEKCTFLKESVKYLGFIIDKKGLHPDPMKVDAIARAPRPMDVTQLKSFLGILNYYGKFIPNLSLMIHPLHKLLKKGNTWNWSPECEHAFKDAKKALTSDRVLAHYEEGRPLVLSVDSSAYGVGAVLAHSTPQGERPVSCASRTLNDAEKNYSQLDKEALAIFFGVTRHHHYLFGRKFTLRTDHQPLSHILGPKQGIPQTAASRLQRWAVRLAAYDFKVEFVRSSENGPADALSRLPLSSERRCTTRPLGYMNIVIDNVPVDFRDVSKHTKGDALLSKILGYVKFGWPLKASCEEEKSYFERKKDIVTELDCLIYKYRIIIPPKLRKMVLEEIHEGHLGINKMKNLSRNYVYWPGLDSDLETVCRTCEACRAVRDAPPHAAMHPWEYPLVPWQRIHADFGEYADKRYLIIVDAHSKWIEVITMTRTDALSTISAFRSIFARFGLPALLVTDNGPPFFSEEFKNFCLQNCIRHVTSAPYRPQGNGAAENAVKTIKKAIKRAVHTGENVEKALSVFLFSYRNCEHATTGVSPAVLMLGRRLRNRLDALRPDLATVVRAAQQRQVTNAKGNTREINVGEPVLVRNYSAKGNKWEQGTVTAKTGPVSYKVGLDKGLEWRRHHNQLLPVKDKSRFSLTQTNINPSREEEKTVEDYAEEFEDAADVGSSEDGNKVPDITIKPSEVNSKPVDSECSTLPEPKVSARALRAMKRAIKQ